MPKLLQWVESWGNLDWESKKNIDWESLARNGEWMEVITIILEKNSLLKRELEEKREVIREGEKILKRFEKEVKKMGRKSYYEKWLTKKTDKIQILDEAERKKTIEEEWISEERKTVFKLLALLKAKKVETKDLKFKLAQLKSAFCLEKDSSDWYRKSSKWWEKLAWEKLAKESILSDSNHWLKIELNMERKITKQQIRIIDELENKSRVRIIIIIVLVIIGVVAAIIKIFPWIKNQFLKWKKKLFKN